MPDARLLTKNKKREHINSLLMSLATNLIQNSAFEALVILNPYAKTIYLNKLVTDVFMVNLFLKTHNVCAGQICVEKEF